MDEILYCFKLNKETGEIKRIDIKNYERGKWTGSKNFFRYRINSNIYYAYENDLERFKNDRMYTFNPSMERAVEEIQKKLTSNRDIAKHELEKWETLLDKLHIEVEV